MPLEAKGLERGGGRADERLVVAHDSERALRERLHKPLLLRMLADNEGQSAINDYVGWMLQATQALAADPSNPATYALLAERSRESEELRAELAAVDTRLTGRMDTLESDQEAMSLTLAAQRARASTYGAIAAAGVSIVAAPLFAILVDAIRK